MLAVSSDLHPPSEIDRPANTISTVLSVSPQHVSREDAPAHAITARDNRQESILAPSRLAAKSWPWDCPATTVTSDDRIPPAGHHDGSYMSHGIKLSERARLILQGFAEDWKLLAPTKTGRSSMLGQAMPPPLAEAVARSIAAHIAQGDDAPPCHAPIDGDPRPRCGVGVGHAGECRA